ncbi:ankyrin repeat-containing protein ITN1-like isoform X1 [Carya illinoinensis]|nr:ankyrin repeat-containing protein ITN1-like isoform X1 [Carya illinoinensis]XP_042983167.1 ankyrin repeat-containing protein ITN1-like isoform X1 [Carya illinoinensis]
MLVANIGFSGVLYCFALRPPQLVMTTVHHTEAITGMDSIIYKAAAQGNLEAISDPLDGFLTVNKNTILHICISSILVEEKFPATGGTDPASAAKFVKDVLDKCPSLLLKANAEDDSPLHVAARYGHASIVRVLIEHKNSQHQDLESGVVKATTEMIGKLNKEGDTALHEAVRHNHIEVVKQLLMEVDPEFSFGANVAGETPLYLAAERHFPDLVSEILNKLKSPAYNGPLGRTALHAAAFWDDEGMTQNILERYGRDLCRQADQNGWTPLHMAAYKDNIGPTKLLLKYDREVAYMKDAEGRTALHIAAHRHQESVTLVKIIAMCPDCCEVVDNEGRNALHLAVHNNRPRAALIIQYYLSLRNLLNQKDNNGNTPLHHYYNSAGYDLRTLDSPRVDKMVFNKKNQNAYQFLTNNSFPTVHGKKLFFFKDAKNYKFYHDGRVLEVGYDEIEKKRPKMVGEVESNKERMKKMEDDDKAAQIHLVVATLISTVTFAAGITMPGGFVGVDDHPHPGSAVLRKSVAFKAFIITNALSLMLSTSAVFIHLFIPLITSTYLFENRKSFLRMAFWFLLSSMAPMVLAFVTGTYAVLAHSDIAIPTCIICLSFLLVLVVIFLKFKITDADSKMLSSLGFDS